MRRIVGEADRAVAVAELGRQGIAALPDPHAVRRIAAWAGALADVTDQAGDWRAVDDHFVRAVGPDRRIAGGVVLQAQPRHLQFPCHGGSPFVSVRCSTSAAGPTAAWARRRW